MEISSAKYTKHGDICTTLSDGTVVTVPVQEGNRHYGKIVEWVSEGNLVDPYVAPPPMTDDEEFQKLIENPKVKALFLAIAQKAGFNSVDELKTAWKLLLP